MTSPTKRMLAFQEVSIEDGKELYEAFLHEGEIVEIAFKSIRDRAIFTNKRIILIDPQGLTGSKKEYMFIHYSRITALAVETGGTFDLDAEFKFWVSGLGGVELGFVKKTNILGLASIINRYVS